MSSFIAIGSVMVLVAVAIVLWPLLKNASGRGRMWSSVGIVVVAVPMLAVALYQAWSNWDWNAPPPAPVQATAAAPAGEIPPFVQQMVSGLEAKLKADPSNFEGWMMLGRSYFQLQRYEQSVNAYQQAYTLTRGGNVDAVIGLGEAMVYADPQMSSGPAAELFEQAYEAAPQHPKVLWYSGIIAYQSGNLERASERWGALSKMNPPETVKKILDEKLQEMDEALTKKTKPSPAQ